MARHLMSLPIAVFLLLGLPMMLGLPRVAMAEEPSPPLSTYESRVVDLVNAERAKAGLGMLSLSATLTASARGYASYMASANFFSHVGPDGSNLSSRDQVAGYVNWTWLGENLAAGQTTPEAAMSDWMASPGHRANILSPSPREIGVGYVTGGNYGRYWVQEFGSRPTVVFAAAPLYQSSGDTWTSPATGHTVSGNWLAFLRNNGNVDNMGYPRTEVIADPTMGGQTAQYFQRLILEFHPENPPAYQIQRRLLGDALYPGADAPVARSEAPPGDAQYFPFTPDRPTGLGHFVSDLTRSGQATYFKQYFDSHGGVNAFGFPKEEPKLRNGLWTQRFQAAVFEYHPENDRDGMVPGTNNAYRNYRVQLALLGDEYIARGGLPFR